MRARNFAIAASICRTSFVAVVLISLLSCAVLADRAITKVDVANMADRVVICVEGNHPLSMASFGSSAGRFLGFQFPTKLVVPGKMVGIRSGRIYNVKYSNFRGNPPIARLVVNTATSLQYSSEWNQDKSRVEISVWKHGVVPQRQTETASVPVHKTKVSNRVEEAKCAEAIEPIRPIKLTEESKQASETIQETPAVAAVEVAPQPEPTVVAKPVRVAPRQLTEERRQVYVAMLKLGSEKKVALDVAVKQPEPLIKVAGMVETEQREPIAAAPVRMAANPTIVLEIKQDPKAAAPAPKAEAPEQQNVKKVSLNFLGADINDVLKALSVQTGQNIVANKDVVGTVTVSLSDVSLEEALDYVARLSGYGYKKENGVYLVASKDALRTLSTDGSPASKTELVKLAYAKADDVINLTKAQYPDVQISRVGVELTGRVGLKSKAGQTSIGLQNSLIVLIGPASSVDQAKDLISKFEEAFKIETIESTKSVYKIKHVDATELANAVATLIPGISVQFAPTEGFDYQLPKPVEVGETGSQVEQDNSDTASVTETAGQSAIDSVGTISETGSAANMGSTVSKTQKKKRPQALIISGRALDVQKAMELAAEYDVRAPQIKIEAKITSLNKAGAKQLGFSWDWSKINFLESLKLVSGVPKDEDGTAIPGFDPVTKGSGNFYRDAMSVSGVLDALATSGNAKVLASPNLICLEGKPGVFFVGDEVTYIQRIEQTATGQNIQTDTKQVGVQLRVIGDVSPDGYITLNLHPEVSVLKLNKEEGITVPIVTRRFTDQIARVKDGETIVIGGLIRSDELKEMRKVPILGDLPLLGNLFRRSNKETAETEVVMFLTASIVKE